MCVCVCEEGSKEEEEKLSRWEGGWVDATHKEVVVTQRKKKDARNKPKRACLCEGEGRRREGRGRGRDVWREERKEWNAASVDMTKDNAIVCMAMRRDREREREERTGVT